MPHTHHSHTSGKSRYGPAFLIGISLNIGYVIVEVVYGLRIGSSALLADAGHNFSDVISLVLSGCALLLTGVKASWQFTYGYRKFTILASLINGLLIIGASGLILWNAIEKLQAPPAIPGNTLMLVAGAGLIVNTGTALLFLKGQQEDLNIRGAFLHMAADAAVTASVLAGGLLMKLTAAYWIDPVLSLIIVGVILYSAWGLLNESVRLVLDGVPKEIDTQAVQQYLENLDCVQEVHDLHIWAISTSETAMTAHLVIPDGCHDDFLYRTRDALEASFGISHSTLQVEHSLSDDQYRYHKV
jgi:cobalt-zinc-cadmium efflux system protein